MQIALLGSANSWYGDDLARAAAGRHQLQRLAFSELASTIADSQLSVASGPTPLNPFHAVLVRTMPPGSLEQVVFRMNALAQLEAAGTIVLNPPRALEVAVDKYLCQARLAQAGLPTPPTVVCQDVDQAMSAFHSLGEDCVLKPIFGSEGRGLMRLTDEGLALRAFKTLAQLNAVIYLQQFVPHQGYDVRVLLLGDQAWCIRRSHPTDWRTNVSRGAKAEPFPLDDQHLQLAQAAADVVGAPFAGVDLLPTIDGRLFVLEVNAVPGWRAVSRTLDVDIAAQVLTYLENLAG